MEKMMTWKVLILISCCASFTSTGRITNRDDSGMITIKDVVKVSINMCSTLARLNTLLKGTAFKLMGVNKLVNNMVTPIPNPAFVVEPLGVMKYIAKVVFNSTRFLDRLARVPNLTTQQAQTSVKNYLNVLNKTHVPLVTNCSELTSNRKCVEEVMDFLSGDESANDLFVHLALTNLRKAKPSSVYYNPGGAFLTLEEVLRGVNYACREIRKRENVFEGEGFLGFLQVGNTWIPVRDRRYPLNVVRLVDPWGFRQIPRRIYTSLKNTTDRITSSWKGFIENVLNGNKTVV